MTPSPFEPIQENAATSDNFSNSNANNRSATINSNTDANISAGIMNNSHVEEMVDHHSSREQQPSPVPPILNIENAPVATHNTIRRISSEPASDDFHNSLGELSLDVTPSEASRSPSLPRTGTMLMREQQDQQMTTLLSSVSSVLRLLKNSSDVSQLMIAAQSLSMLCGRGNYVCRSHTNKSYTKLFCWNSIERYGYT